MTSLSSRFASGPQTTVMMMFLFLHACKRSIALRHDDVSFMPTAHARWCYAAVLWTSSWLSCLDRVCSQSSHGDSSSNGGQKHAVDSVGRGAGRGSSGHAVVPFAIGSLGCPGCIHLGRKEGGQVAGDIGRHTRQQHRVDDVDLYMDLAARNCLVICLKMMHCSASSPTAGRWNVTLSEWNVIDEAACIEPADNHLGPPRSAMQCSVQQ